MNTNFIQLFENFNAEYKYSSIQFDLPKDIAKEILSFGKSISNNLIYNDPEDLSYGRENNIHCTILYGIHDTSYKESEKLLSDIKPFNIKLGKISFFPDNKNNKYKVIKIEVISKDVHKLNSLIKSNLEYTNKFNVYHPHITIAYVLPDFDEKSIDKDLFKDKEVNINSLLFSSKNKKKTVIHL